MKKESLCSSEIGTAKLETGIALINYVSGLRLVNNGIATFDRFDEPVSDKILRYLVVAELHHIDLDLAKHFARRTHQPHEQFQVNCYLSEAVAKQGEDPSEYYGIAKESLKSFPSLTHTAAAWAYLAFLEIKLGKDPHHSLSVSKIILSQLFSTLEAPSDLPDFIPRKVIPDVNPSIAVIATDIAAIESVIDQDPSEAFQMAKQAIIRIHTPTDKVEAALYLAETEKTLGRSPSASLLFARNSIDEVRIIFKDSKFIQERHRRWTEKVEKTLLKIASDEQQEQEEITEEEPVPLVPTRGFKTYLYQAEECAKNGDNPIPYLDAAKEKVILGTIRNKKTIAEYLEIAKTEINVGLMLIDSFFGKRKKTQGQDVISVFEEAIDAENREFLEIFGTFLPEALHEYFLKTVPVEKQDLVTNAFLKGLFLKYA